MRVTATGENCTGRREHESIVPVTQTFVVDGLRGARRSPRGDADGVGGGRAGTVPVGRRCDRGQLTRAHAAWGRLGNLVQWRRQFRGVHGHHKDIQDIPDWAITSGRSPDKAEITNAYAAAYTSATGDLILYFGADRISNNGDTFLGFWFFKEPIDVTGGDFIGQHTVGDTLVLVNFPQATNAQPDIKVVQWVGDDPLSDPPGCAKAASKDPSPGECAAKSLRLLLEGTGDGGAVCDSNDLSNPIACAIANDENGPNDPTPSPWPYTFKDGSTGNFPFETFFEGGINITELVGGPACFSSFMAETRSSSSFTASLKDFVLSDFDVCAISVSKACEVMRLTNAEDDADRFFSVAFQGSATNTGGGTFGAGETVTVIDDAGTPGCVEGDEPACDDDVILEIILEEPLMPGESIPFEGSYFSNDNPPYNTVTASISFGSDTVGADPFGTECTPLSLSPAISLSKQCSTELTTTMGLLAVEVNFSGRVCNTGDVPLSVTVDNDMPEDPTQIFSGDLVVPADPQNPTVDEGACADLSGTYLPSATLSGTLDPLAAMFQDTLTAVGTSDVPGVDPVQAMATDTCDLCPCP
jgi:hypothetical protein